MNADIVKLGGSVGEPRREFPSISRTPESYETLSKVKEDMSSFMYQDGGMFKSSAEFSAFVKESEPYRVKRP